MTRGTISSYNTVRSEQQVKVASSLAPLDLIDLFFDFHRLQIVEFWFVRLKLRVELVFAALLLLVALKEDNPAASIPGGQKVSRMFEFNGRYNVG